MLTNNRVADRRLDRHFTPPERSVSWPDTAPPGHHRLGLAALPLPRKRPACSRAGEVWYAAVDDDVRNRPASHFLFHGYAQASMPSTLHSHTHHGTV